MPLIRAIRMLNALEAGTINAAAFEALLADPGRQSDFSALMSMPGQANRAAASALTAAAIGGSARGSGLMIVARHGVGAWLDRLIITGGGPQSDDLAECQTMTEVFTRPAALDALASHAATFGMLLGNATVRSTIWGSDAMLAGIPNSAAALAAMRAHARSSLISQAANTVATPVTGIAAPMILLGWSCSANGVVTLTGRRANSAVGSLTATSGTITGTTAAFANVMPLTGNVTVAVGSSGRTMYLQVFEV